MDRRGALVSLGLAGGGLVSGGTILVDLGGSLWIWNEWCRQETGDRTIRARALKSRLVADVTVDDR